MKTLTITIFLFAVSLNSKAQYIPPVDFSKLLHYTLNDNTVNDIETKLTGLSPNWQFRGDEKKGDVLHIKWTYIPQNQDIIQAQFSLNSTKINDEIVRTISYTFFDERWFNEYITAVKSLDSVDLIHNEKETGGVIRQVYQSSSTIQIFSKTPFNQSNIPYRYSVEMHYNLK